MGSIAQRRGIYDGEYAPTGLRLFVWWKRNRERRLQKQSSGSAQIMSYMRPPHQVLYIGVRYLEAGARSTAHCAARQTEPRRNRSHLVGVVVRLGRW
jgi:hypothetical protein